MWKLNGIPLLNSTLRGLRRGARRVRRGCCSAPRGVLFSNGIPFSFHITARYLDPNGYYNDGVSRDVPLSTQPLMIAAIRAMQQLGGVMIHHGYTHQYSNIANPYTAVTGDDCEFYRITSNSSNGVLTFVGPLPGDTDSSWAQGRFNSYAAE